MQYTDYIGYPIKPGDTILYPNQRGVFNIATVYKIIALVPHPDGNGRAYARWAREDQINKSPHPTAFGGEELDEKPEKRYVVQIMQERSRGWGDNRVTTQQKYSLPTRHVLVLPVGSEAK